MIPVDIIFVEPIPFPVSTQNCGPTKVYLTFSTTKTCRCDHLVRIRTGISNLQDKSMTLKNADVIRTEQRILKANVCKQLQKRTTDAETTNEHWLLTNAFQNLIKQNAWYMIVISITKSKLTDNLSANKKYYISNSNHNFTYKLCFSSKQRLVRIHLEDHTFNTRSSRRLVGNIPGRQSFSARIVRDNLKQKYILRYPYVAFCLYY